MVSDFGIIGDSVVMSRLRALIAGEQRSVLLERSWSAKEAKRRAGKNPQSAITLPFGVGYDEKQGWYYKPETERVREAFRMMLAKHARKNRLISDGSFDFVMVKRRRPKSIAT